MPADDGREVVMPLPEGHPGVASLRPAARHTLDPSTAVARVQCPTCGAPAFVWLWLPFQTRPTVDRQPEGVHLDLHGLVTDLVHESPTDCGGLA